MTTRRFFTLHGEVGFDVWEGNRPIIVGLSSRQAAKQAIKEIHDQELMVAFVAESITKLRAVLRDEFHLTEEEIVARIREQLP